MNEVLSETHKRDPGERERESENESERERELGGGQGCRFSARVECSSQSAPVNDNLYPLDWENHAGRQPPPF